MHKIRNDQLKAFDDEAEKSFRRKVLEHLKAEHPESVEGVDEKDLEIMVANGIGRARSHGFTWESSVAAFVMLMFEVAPNFDQHPAFRQHLEDKKLEEMERIEAIFNFVTDEEWAEAQDKYDDEAWGLPDN